ncbi:MAG: hypothetical protein AMJ78_05285 [Omnitrophica WOR_2 bacterium SM23_29]|nr:MAG: hypothetical protein AMJ78_05285 [Omnitrophica WOR_2 bacterium SM23_29]
MSRLIVLVSLVALLMAPSIASANLVVNPGFEGTGEQGHMTGWTVDWNPGNIAATEDNPHSGAWAARNFWDGGMYQDIAITPGLDYKLTGYAYIPTGVGGSPWGTYIGLKYINAAGATVGNYQIDMQGLTRDQYNMADTGWRTAPATAVAARVRFGTWSSDPWEPVNPTDFDDFDLSPIPEPASLVLLGSGLVGLVAFTRKRRI